MNNFMSPKPMTASMRPQSGPVGSGFYSFSRPFALGNAFSRLATQASKQQPAPYQAAVARAAPTPTAASIQQKIAQLLSESVPLTAMIGIKLASVPAPLASPPPGGGAMGVQMPPPPPMPPVPAVGPPPGGDPAMMGPGMPPGGDPAMMGPGMPPGMPPGGDPAMMGPGMPPGPPMSPIPATPPVNPPRPRSSADATQEAVMLSLFEQGQRGDPVNEEIQSDLLASGEKMAGDAFWNGWLVKEAGPLPTGAGKGLMHSVGNAFSGVGKWFGRNAAKIPKPMLANAAASGGGAVMGGFAGEDMGMPRELTIEGPYGMRFNAGGAAAGAAAFNPYLNKRFGKGIGAVPINAVRGGIAGGFAGGTAGDIGENMGLIDADTSALMGRRGAQLGAASGATYGGMRAAKTKMLMMRRPTGVFRPGGQVYNTINSGLRHADSFGRGVTDFAEQGFRMSPMMQAVSAPWRVGKAVVQGTNPLKALAQPFTEGWGKGIGARLGLTGGALGLGALGIGHLNRGIQNKANEVADQTLGHVATDWLPHIKATVQDSADKYLAEKGMLDPSGHITGSGVVDRTLRDVRQNFSLDRMIASLGLDPRRMHPMQKQMFAGQRPQLAGMPGQPQQQPGPVARSQGGYGYGQQGLPPEVAQELAAMSPADRNEFMTQLAAQQQQ